MITNKASGSLTAVPTTMVASGGLYSRLVKNITVTNLDNISHILHLEVGVTLTKVLLFAGDSLHFNSTTALGADNLVGYVEEAIVGTSPTYVVSYLDENETV